MRRYSNNHNLSLTREYCVGDTTFYNNSGDLSVDYLDRLKSLLFYTLDIYSTVYSFRVDLRYPINDRAAESRNNSILDVFFRKLSEYTESNLKERKKRSNDNRVNWTDIHYAWARECGEDGRHHYHCVLMFNGASYNSIGELDIYGNGCYGRVCRAWAYALNIPIDSTRGLVEYPSDSAIMIHNNDTSAIIKWYSRVSYLAKVYSKVYGDRTRNWGMSKLVHTNR